MKLKMKTVKLVNTYSLLCPLPLKLPTAAGNGKGGRLKPQPNGKHSKVK